ncbi:MAG: maleylpyruvate isomerase N-terminal domain-containing protein [Acidobacteria bacterium]|nr:maleylpyruvate isomerase N-terminal domain-containing protein [Acidobacteriota bacterium]
MARPPAPAGPIHALDALYGTETRLRDLLDTLTTREWDVPTIVPGWRVRHVAGHLLDAALRRLSLTRDGVAFERPAADTAEALRTFVDRLNAEGVAVYGRLSPAVLRSLMRPASAALCTWMAQRGPDLPADFPVSWAGDTASPQWFDVARELTERWHHQQQIRLALDRPGLMVRELYHPVLDCFMRALPWRFRDVAPRDGGHVAVVVTGECGDTWRLHHDGTRWQLTMDDLPDPITRITIGPDIAWRIFTKGIPADEARRRCRIEGDDALAARVLATTAIVG